MNSLDLNSTIMSNSDLDFHITTPRLYISHHHAWNDAHCDLMVNLKNSPSSIKHNPDGPSLVPNREAARSLIEANSERMARTGYGRFVISLRPDNDTDTIPFPEKNLELIGVVSMQQNRFQAFPGPLIPDVGFNVLPEYQGKGYANEAATHLMKYFREVKGSTAFAGLTADGNEEAKKCFARLGFRSWGVRRVNGVVFGGRESQVSVWTIGVDDKRALEGLRL
jgi:RimJ/RimL family protein N-acetyltransferase